MLLLEPRYPIIENIQIWALPKAIHAVIPRLLLIKGIKGFDFAILYNLHLEDRTLNDFS